MKIVFRNSKIEFQSTYQWEDVKLTTPGAYLRGTGDSFQFVGYDPSTKTFTNTNCCAAIVSIDDIAAIKFKGAGLNVGDYNIGFFTTEPTVSSFIKEVSIKDELGMGYEGTLDLTTAKKAGAKYLFFGDYSKVADGKAYLKVTR